MSRRVVREEEPVVVERRTSNPVLVVLGVILVVILVVLAVRWFTSNGTNNQVTTPKVTVPSIKVQTNNQ